MIELYYSTQVPLTEWKHVRTFGTILEMLRYFGDLPEEETHGCWLATDATTGDTILDMEIE